MSDFTAFGLGLAHTNAEGEILDTFFPTPIADHSAKLANEISAAFAGANIANEQTNRVCFLTLAQTQALAESLEYNGQSKQAKTAGKLAKLSTSSSQQQIVAVLLTCDAPPESIPEAFLKLHLLSHRLVKPHQIDLNGVFGILKNLAWTNEGPIELAAVSDRQCQARLAGKWLHVKCVDKFPPMVDYVVPSGVRIADTARVRLGAHIGSGTTIMHEGFVNFNAGTAGASMIEGRISAGVFVGEGSDLGGGSSTMGTLSGGGDVVISVGENCLVGANAGIGIALGDRCIVEAGLYVTAGTKVNMLDEADNVVEQCKARDLHGKSDLLFRRNSQSGAVECKRNKSAVELNDMLHAND